MADLGQLLSEYKTSAIRIESLPLYKVSGEWENYQVFLAEGKILRDGDLLWYLNLIAQKEKSGASNLRIRVIDLPISLYLKYEYFAGYCPATESGSQVFFIDRADYDEIKAKNNFRTVDDFWLFDSMTLVSMHYNKDGEWRGAEILKENDEVIKARKLIEELRNKSIDMAHFSNLLTS